MLAPIEGQPAFPGFELGVSNGPFIRRGRIAAATRELAPGDKDKVVPLVDFDRRAMERQPADGGLPASPSRLDHAFSLQRPLLELRRKVARDEAAREGKEQGEGGRADLLHHAAVQPRAPESDIS